MLILPYKGMNPKIGAGVYIAPNATVVGDVTIGDDSSIWFGTVVRGDVHSIRIGARSNIQDNCVVHVTNGVWPTVIEDDVTIGHGVIAHGCTIGRGCLIGMGARLLDGVVVGEESLVGAGALITEGTQIPPRSLVIGFPARVRRELTADELVNLRKSSSNYVSYKNDYLEQAKESR
ncbi:MAG: gamma carbonic anhydrase family protein [Acidobacteria bacterium]|nr:gamma carbonic anhydrase family protein [Acidobacteriota bacterium]